MGFRLSEACARHEGSATNTCNYPEPATISPKALNVITETFNYDILADDALFMTAVILEEDLKDTEQSMHLYTQLLTQFPGSIYVSEARKRFRELRGDF